MEFEVKQKQEFINKTFRFNKNLADRLAVAATNNNVSLNEFVCQACEFALLHLKDTKKE